MYQPALTRSTLHLHVSVSFSNASGGERLRTTFFAALLCVLLVSSIAGKVRAQAGGHKLYGDLKVDESKAGGIMPISFDVILYSLAGNVLGRQSVPNRGRYQFFNVSDGQYDVVIEVENREVARARVQVFSPFRTDFRQDIELEWHSNAGDTRSVPATVSVADSYVRSDANEKIFNKAQKATDEKKYDQAVTYFRQIIESDAKDFQAWTELGTVYLFQQNISEAENAYATAIEVRPGFFLGLMNLGRLRIMKKDFAGAIPILTRAVEIKPTSAEVNYYLGEAYLQIKKGSKAVPYLYEALKLDPVGKADAHLRLAALYNGAGLKDKAAAEYEAFLKKKPDYPDRKKLEQYIAANKGAADPKKP